METQEIEVLFQNNESPGTPLECTWNGRRFLARDGQKVKWPTNFIHHLHTDCVYPRYDYEIDQVTGQLVHKIVGAVRRFSCVPTSLEAHVMPASVAPNEFELLRQEIAQLREQNALLQQQLAEKLEEEKQEKRPVGRPRNS